MKSKKAAVEIQLNWIFILIVGAVILLFFVTVAKKVSTSSETQIASTSLKNFDTIISGISTTTDFSKKVTIPKADIEYSCYPTACNSNLGCTSDFSYKGKNIDMSQKVLFSPQRISSSTLTIWTQDWLAPFKVTNFIYFSRPDIKYILVHEGMGSSSYSLGHELYDVMTDNEFLNVELIESGSELLSRTITENDYWIRLVYLYPTVPPTLQNIQAEDVDYIIVTPDSNNLHQGSIKFSKDSLDHIYVGIPSLLGAIFSQDPDHYRCNMNKALFKYQKIYNVIQTRATAIEQDVSQDPILNGCEYYYQFAATPASQISLQSISQIANLLETNNQNALLNSCPRIY